MGLNKEEYPYLLVYESRGTAVIDVRNERHANSFLEAVASEKEIKWAYLVRKDLGKLLRGKFDF